MRIHPRLRSTASLLLLSLTSLVGCRAKDDGTGPDDNAVPGIEFDMLAGVLMGELAGVGGAMMLPSGPPGCLTITADEDTDGDGLPQNADFTFSSSGCLFTFDEGSGTTAGSIHVVDAGEAFGFSATLNGVAYTLSVNAMDGDPAETRVRTLTGSRTIGGSPSGLTMTQDMTLTYTVTNKPNASATESWQAAFTPAQGSSAVFGYGHRLPDGGVVVSGPMSWTQSGATVQLTLETTVPLRFPPSCESPFPSAGEVHVHVVSGGPSGYVRVMWTGCGAETQVDFIEG